MPLHGLYVSGNSLRSSLSYEWQPVRFATVGVLDDHDFRHSRRRVDGENRSIQGDDNRPGGAYGGAGNGRHLQPERQCVTRQVGRIGLGVTAVAGQPHSQPGGRQGHGVTWPLRFAVDGG